MKGLCKGAQVAIATVTCGKGRGLEWSRALRTGEEEGRTQAGPEGMTGCLTIWSRLWKWQGLRTGGAGGGGSGEGRASSHRSSSSISSSRCTRAGAATPKRQARRPSSSRHNSTLFTFLRSTRSSVSNISTSGVRQRREGDFGGLSTPLPARDYPKIDTGGWLGFQHLGLRRRLVKGSTQGSQANRKSW